MLFLSVDFGTSAVKMSVVDENNKTLQWTKEDYPYILLPGEKVELDPGVLMAAFVKAAGRLDGDLRRRVDLFCYDTFSPSLVFLDEKGEPVYPNIITHLDRRSRGQSAYIVRTFGRDNYMNISGIYPFAGGVSAMTLLWFKQKQPEILDTAARIGHLTTYIHKKLTGTWAVDLVNASMMGLYETTTQGGWSDVLLREFGLRRETLSEIVYPGKILGSLLPEIASSLGLRSGIPVAMGTNDVACAQMGAGNTKAGCIMNTAGSSEMVSILTDRPVVNPEYYLRNAALPGLWQIYATTAGGFAVDWFHNQFCKEMTKKEFFKEYMPKCIEADKGEVEVVFQPYLTGDRQSLRKKRGAWTGLTLAATRDQMLVALLKSMQGVLYKTIRQAEKVLPLERVIKVAGGLATPDYMQIKKLEMPDFTFEVVEDCPILGNVALAKHYM